MSTDYKNLFNKKKDYSNLFSDKQKQTRQESNMSYKNIFGNSVSVPEVTKIKSVFPEKQIDPRVKDIQAINAKISTQAVISWLDNFDSNFKKFTTINQEVSQRELDLAMGFTNGRLQVQTLFNDIKQTVSKLKGPQKKPGLLSRILGSNGEFKLTQEIITEVIQEIKLKMDQFKNKAKYNTSMFLKSEMRSIEVKILDLKSDLECAIVATTYMINNDDFKGTIRLEKLKQVSGLINISELQLKNTYQLLEKDLEAYENLKNMTIPFLYAKIQTLMSSTLDSEVLNVIDDIDKL